MAKASSGRGAKIPLHPQVKALVSRESNILQVTLRWLAVLGSSIVAVQVGVALDLVGAGSAPSAGWWAVTLLSIAVAALSQGFAVLQAHRLQSRAETQLRLLAQQSWNRLGPLHIQDRAGGLLDVATNGAMRAARYRGAFLSASIASLSAPIIVCVTMGLSLGWSIAGWMSLIIVVGPFLVGIFQRSTKAPGQRFRVSQVFLRSSFLEGIQALESLVYAGAGRSYARRLARDNEVHRRKIMSLLAGNQSLLFFMDIVFSMAAVLLAAWLAIRGLDDGRFSPGQAVSLLLLTMIMVAPVDLIGQFFYIGIGGRATQRQFSALAYEAEASAPVAAGTATAPSADEPPIQFHQVTAGWPEGPDLLADTSWQVDQGERVALVGPSGIGKSTISALIQGLLQPGSGQVTLFGVPTADASPPDLSAQLAVVEQRTYLFSGSIADNLRIAKAEASDEELYRALDLANLGDEIRSFPEGLATEVGDRGARLSGGQTQRLAIARAFLKEAPILILDEPTSQVDLTGEALILQAIERISAERTVVMIAHRRAAIKDVDRVLVVKERNVVISDEQD